MRFKIPRKKRPNKGIAGQALLVLLLLLTFSVWAGEDTAQDRALFWSIQKDGEPAGYLLGTIHSEDPRVLEFSGEFLRKLEENSVFAMEMLPDIAMLGRLAKYMYLPDGTTLESVVGPSRYASLVSAMSELNVPAEFISGMRPWAAMLTLSTPSPETGFFMDMSISLRAAGSGLETIGLETLEQQLSFLQDMPMAMQLDLLDQAIEEFGQVQQAHDQMVDAYLKNDLTDLQALSDEQMDAAGHEASEYFMEFGIRARNLQMAETLWPFLENQRVFVAVGALHLPGKDGLINLLRRQGYQLAPLALPFSEDQEVPRQ